MKKLLFILMLIPGIGLSQSIGLKAGLLTNAEPGDHSTNGVYGVTLHFGKKFQFGIEPGVYTLGVKVFETDNKGNRLEEKQVKFNYFEIPLTFGYVGGEKFLYGASVGISPKYFISGTDNIEPLVRLNADFIASGCIGFKTGEKTRLLLNIRYGHAITTYSYISSFINFQYKL